MAKNPNRQDLPFELVYEILTNLPVKPLTKFRSVCKPWNSLISNHSFQREQHRRALQRDPVILVANVGDDALQPDPVILVASIGDDYDAKTLDFYTLESYSGDEIISDFSIQFSFPPSHSDNCQSVQSCQGLVCVNLSADIFVCNPATRQIIVLSDWDPCCVGFGYATSVNEFKVVRFTDFFLNPFCEILTFGTREWRKTSFPHPGSYSKMSLYAPFLHGAVHFLSDSRDHNADDAIYALDIESEEYRTSRFSEYYYTSVGEHTPPPCRHCLNELRGSLCLAVILEAGMELWFLKYYYNGKWEKKYIIGFPFSRSRNVWGEPLAILGNGNTPLKIVDGGTCWQYWYNPEDKTFIENIVEDYTATTCAESLLSPAAYATQ